MLEIIDVLMEIILTGLTLVEFIRDVFNGFLEYVNFNG